MTDNRDFPFPVAFTLDPLVEVWQAATRDEVPHRAAVAREIVDRVRQLPVLEGVIEDFSIFQGHEELLEALLTGVLPSVLRQDIYGAVLEPFHFRTAYATPAARRLDLFNADTFVERLSLPPEVAYAGRIMMAYKHVLEEFYEVHTDFGHPLVLTVDDRPTGLERHFRISLDRRFVQVVLRGDLPELDQSDLERLLAEPMNIGLWKEILPPDRFEFQGLTLATAVEVTDTEVISRLKRDLLVRGSMSSPEGIDVLEARLRQLMRRPHLRLGLIAIESANDVDVIDRARPIGRSLLLDGEGPPPCSSRQDSYYSVACAMREPLSWASSAGSSRSSAIWRRLATSRRSSR